MISGGRLGNLVDLRIPLNQFDSFSNSYEGELSNALGVFGGDPSFFIEQKVQVLAREIGKKSVREILDFGSGVGLAVPFILKYLEPYRLTCTDESIESLRILKARFPRVETVKFDYTDGQLFDLVFISNVLHHVDQSRRQLVLSEVCKRLAPNGLIAIFEHNPMNPMTRFVVDRCEFDKGVVLLKKRESELLIRGLPGIVLRSSGYCLFFPKALRRLAKFDRHLKRFPLGAQYFVIGERLV